MAIDRAEAAAFYRRYIGRCNQHRFGELDTFVLEGVLVNGEPQSVQQYGDGLASMVEAFPDLHWEVRHMFVDGDWLSVHLTDTATTPDGREATIEEFAIYRMAGGRIAEVWGDLDRGRFEPERSARQE